jgi:ribosomal protein S25
MVELLAANPFITTAGVARQLAVAFTTAQRAIERLERSGIVQQTSHARRNRVYYARVLLDILEEPAQLKSTAAE